MYVHDEVAKWDPEFSDNIKSSIPITTKFIMSLPPSLFLYSATRSRLSFFDL